MLVVDMVQNYLYVGRMKTLATWIGTNDLYAAEGREGAGIGSIAGALATDRYDRIVLLANDQPKRVEFYAKWLIDRFGVPATIHQLELSDPTDFHEIVAAVTTTLDKEIESSIDVPEWTFNFSSGTPTMRTVWGIFSLTKYPGRLVQSSPEHGAKTFEIPFALSAEFSPEDLAPADERLARLSRGLLPETYSGFQFKSAAMTRLMKRVEKVIGRSFPFVIEGEQGTEKEFLARLVHDSSPRAASRFVVFDCLAMDADAIYDQLFGGENHEAAYTAWSRADNGTLFIDNVDRLPLAAQATLQKLLDAEAKKDGSISNLSRYDVRVIAASSKPLMGSIAKGDFLESCFYLLDALVLKIPPLRERRGDLSPLIDRLLERINAQSASEPGFESRRMSPGARNVLLQHLWPGNLRELESTIRRAAIVATSEKISEADALDALMPVSDRLASGVDIMNRPLENGVDLPSVIGEVARSYLKRALEVTEGNKSEAAALLNLKSYQTLSNWLTRYKVE